MRLKPSICAFLVVCWTLVCSYSLNAQEAQPEIESAKEVLRNEPDPVLSESDTRTVNKPSIITGATKEVQRDSVHFKVPKPLKAEKAEKEEDPLSFNFLYYIIEKFKLSDIIE